MNNPALDRMFTYDRYPRTQKYDLKWVLDNHIGSHCLLLMEALSQVMDLRPGMRVLDMGCGKAITSIFLAKEFGVQVWANDLWVGPDDNWQRICEAGVEDKVFPIHAEAHSLPYAKGFFDAIVSVNSLHFFATDDIYLSKHFVRLVKPGGQIGSILPGVYHELTDGVPDYLEPYWDPEFWSYHSAAWWRDHWLKTGEARVELADGLAETDGRDIFVNWGVAVDNPQPNLLTVDNGRNFTFIRVVARRTDLRQV